MRASDRARKITTSQSIMGVVEREHNDATVASSAVLTDTLPQIEQILVSLISPSMRVTLSPLELQDVLVQQL